MKRIGTGAFILFSLALGVSGVFNLAQGIIHSLTAKKPTTSQPTEQGQPITTTTPTTISSDKTIVLTYQPA
jgi:hypothetical protein